MITKADWVWVLLLLSLYAVLSLGTAWRESATYDEPLHILTGTFAWKNAGVNLDYANPPVSPYWQTLPLLALHFHPFAALEPSFDTNRTYSFGFVNHNRYSLGWMLQAPRTMNVFLAVMLGLALFLWAGQALNRSAALAALVVYVFCPLLLGYGSLATADIGGALGWLLVFFSGWRCKQNPSSVGALFLGLSTGLALCLKYSAILALPTVMVALAYEASHGEPAVHLHARKMAKLLLPFVVGALLVMMISFRGWGLPEWIIGFSKLSIPFKEGHLNYYWGRFGTTGWRTYFFAAVLLKTPLPLLGIILWSGIQWRQFTPDRRNFILHWGAWPVAVILAASSFSSIQVGIRHILAIYPFLCLWVGAATATLWDSHRRSWRYAVLAFGTWYIMETLLVFPRYLSYFNELVGPSANAYHYFVDSNLDWGQGLKALGNFLQKKGSPPIYLSYFGCAEPGAYGIRFQPVAMVNCADLGAGEFIPPTQTPLYFAVSATNRVGLYYDPHDIFAWLDHRQPVAILMDSIWLYDITQDEEAKGRLRLLTRIKNPQNYHK